ncbi:hypothetical protein TKWG_21705 [Advenella kashmirensis WT001]|uniref:Serine hydrolase n=1 Tax=Advenella kashmirensis (strain DSM 17095 / LMG 22695 / WT001) TaxID=1036672 RepID=I3UG82_ADVKW|nr:hypothetical protein [Advenella kashmirensis]AFK64020.1 hypothetical protein TKWG_21705 [Advenella kashmirensis WT001]
MYYQQTEQSSQIGQRLLSSVRQIFAPLAHDVADSSITLHLFPRAAAGMAAGEPDGFSWQGQRQFYPASVVKVAYLTAAQAALRDGKVMPHEELGRAITDMILWSSNNATNYVIDMLSGTTGDTLLPEAEMKQWFERRQGVNRFFAGLGWPEARASMFARNSWMTIATVGKDSLSRWMGKIITTVLAVISWHACLVKSAVGHSLTRA